VTAEFRSGAIDACLIAARPYNHPHVQALTGELYHDQVDRYGFADSAHDDPARYVAPSGLFLVGYVGTLPVTGGGYRRYPARPRTVEIRKMYTRPAWRARGYSRAILAVLEDRAADAGAHHVLLETGVRNTAALALYASMGYRPTARYVPGRPPEINRAFTKTLVPEPPQCVSRTDTPV
jgi:GNAT superfamily N-acetyltransferase